MWVCRDVRPVSYTNNRRFYMLYAKRPSHEKNCISGSWIGPLQVIDPTRFKRLFGFTLRPGEGPIQVTVKREV